MLSAGLFSSLNRVGREQGHTWVRKGGNLCACHRSCVSTLCWNYSTGNFFALVLLFSLASPPRTQDGHSFLWSLPWGLYSANWECDLSLWMHVTLHTVPQIISNLGVHFNISGRSDQAHNIPDKRKSGGLSERTSSVVLHQITPQLNNSNRKSMSIGVIFNFLRVFLDLSQCNWGPASVSFRKILF